MAKALIKLGFKSAIAISAIYWTRDNNVWGTSESAEKVYNQLKKEIDPYIDQARQKINFKPPALPSSGEIGFLTTHYYNCGVKSTFRFIHMLPCYVGRWVKQGKDAINNALEAPPPPPKKS